MPLREIAIVSNRLRVAVAASAVAFLLLTGLPLPCAAADQEQNSEDIPSAQPRAPRRYAAPADDEFLPITKVVPRAKITLHGNERLPDLGGEETFARYGSGTIDYVWYVRDPISPMYPFAYHPIYFEDMNLERCGLSCGCMQSVVSGLMFWGTVAVLPYKMLVSPPCSCVYPPGFPPDDCPPGCRFGYCENFIGPKPDIGRLLGYGSFTRRRTCHR
jgi:hypothetical protein